MTSLSRAWHTFRYGEPMRRLEAWRYGWRWRYALEKLHERRAGAVTMHDVSLADLGIEAKERIWYVPSEWMGLQRAIRSLHVTREDVFVDFGSGKGRALLIAARFPFRRVIGVELAEQLTNLARRNLEAAKRRRCGAVELVTGDALEYEIPDDVTVAYFFCPFTGDVFHGVFERLLESFDRLPRPLRLVYNYPYEHRYLLSTGRVQVVDVHPNRWPPRSLTGPDVIVTYRVVPPGAAPEPVRSLGLRRAPFGSALTSRASGSVPVDVAQALVRENKTGDWLTIRDEFRNRLLKIA